MFGRTTKVRQGELAIGMVVLHDGTWVKIHHIEHASAGSNQRKATCTARRQVTVGGFTVWFAPGEHKVMKNTLPAGFAIKAVPMENPSAPPIEQESRVHVQGGVHNSATGEIRGPLMQTGSIDGQTATDFFKNR